MVDAKKEVSKMDADALIELGTEAGCIQLTSEFWSADIDKDVLGLELLEKFEDRLIEELILLKGSVLC